ncbi:hypothetical protein [Sphingobacterium rhinopitheci]|uniref:hypothetical protein n=1 Tax=Sphingobacterium rhinopitheci TaxID=2781960 RepID=UPI001F525FED|nr:hypothetical protein [Sphingobacterium rhinopitheci]MCI0921346.1 hypothetical protein [Sphingobacterium rhinopitheci]
MKSILGIGVIMLLAMSCNNSPQTSNDNAQGFTIEQLSSNKNAEKQQLFLRFTEEITTDSSTVFIAKSLNDKDTVGMRIEVMNNIQPGINKDGRPVESGFVKGAIKLSSIGEQSDAFVNALSGLFNVPAAGGMTSEVIVPTVFSSNKEVVDVGKPGTYSFKLFLNNEKGEPAEMFAVIDTYRKAFELSEKDPSYRDQVLAAFEGN